MKNPRWLLLLLVAPICLVVFIQQTGAQSNRPAVLHSGWRLTFLPVR